MLDDSGEVVDHFGTRHAAHIFACLAYHIDAKRPLTREFIIEQCWPDQPDEARARNNLAHALRMIRHALGTRDDVLRVNNTHVSLSPEFVTTDVLEFRKHLSEFEAHLSAGQLPTFPADCARHLINAVDTYTGALLPNDDQSWVRCARDELSDEHVQAVDMLVDHLIHLKRYFAALRYAHLSFQLNPDEEKTHFALMRLYVALDRPNAALEQFKKMKRIFRDIGLPPSKVCRNNYDSILSWLQSGRLLPPPSIYNDIARDPDAAKSRLNSRLTFLAIAVNYEVAHITNSIRIGIEEALASLDLLFGDHEGDILASEDGPIVVGFSSPERAINCAVACQIAVAALSVDKLVDVHLRMAIHTDSAQGRESVYRGTGVSTAKLILDCAHVGQILCSQSAMQELVRSDVPQDVSLADRGLYRLRDDLPPQRIYSIDHPNLLREFPPLRVRPSRQIRNVTISSKFVGRDEELGVLRELVSLEEVRLITIAGSPGVGKSRLSEELADLVVEQFSGAVWVVPLADTLDAYRIGTEIAKAIGLPPSSDIEAFEQVTDFLEFQRCLVVLDNFEQLLDSGRVVVKTLIERVPTLTCVITSRQSLGLATEHIFSLDPLSIPLQVDSELEALVYDSVRLFEDRGRDVSKDFQITDQNLAAVVQLCRRLEGVPLAIELAAQHLHSMTPEQMVAKLDEDGRFDLLVTKTRDIDKRHRSYWTAIEWSYRQLPPEVKSFFTRLSVFRGSWTLEAAEAVSGAGSESADYLSLLRSAFLVRGEQDQQTDAAHHRFRMLESIADFAKIQLSKEESAALSWSHFNYFLRIAEAGKVAIEANQPEPMLSRLESEHNNILQALRWARDHDADLGLRLAISLPWFWEMRGHWRVGCLWLSAILERTQSADTMVKARGFLALGNLSKILGEESDAREAYSEGYSLTSGSDSLLVRSFLLTGMGTLAQNKGDYFEANRCMEECLRIKEGLGNPRGIAIALSNLGYCAYIQDDIPTALTYLERAFAIIETIGGVSQLRSNALNNLGGIKRANGDISEARSLLESSLRLRLELNDQRTLTYSFEEFARLAFAEGAYGKAIQLAAAAEALRGELGYRLPTTELARSNSFVDQLRDKLGPEVFGVQWLRGMALSQDQVLNLALNLS